MNNAMNEGFGDLAQSKIVVIPMIDVSGSMAGDRIARVNEAMREVPAQLADINDETLDCELRIAPMEFSTGARWFNLSAGQPAEVENFRWIDMKASGLTHLGAAFDLLNEKLTTTDKGGWMEGRGGCAPIIILISDGEPNDDWEGALKKLKKRGWFNAATKFAVAVGAEASRPVLAQFTGTMEAVIDTEVIRQDLAAIIKKLVVSASKTVSQSVSGLANTNVVTDQEPANYDQDSQEQIVHDVVTNITMDDTDDLF